MHWQVAEYEFITRESEITEFNKAKIHEYIAS